MENAAIITRVSTPGQADNTSPATQLERCRSYCAAKDYRVFAEASEVISGSFVLARSEFIRLQELANEGKISVIVVDISDRLGRGDAAAQLEMLAKLSGARVEYATPGRDTSTVEGLALKATDQLVSGIERMNIRRRVTDGKRPRAAEGRVIESSCRPYGYDFLSTRDKHGRKNSCTLVIREDEAQIVRNIYEWAVFEGLSTYAVAKRLMTLCVPTMRDKEPRGQPKETKYLWRQPVVFGILTNPVYKGKWHYNRRVVRIKDSLEGPRQEYITTNNPDYIPVPVPAIVTEALWEAAQEKLEDNRRKFRRPTKYEYPLRGRIRCAACGYLMTGAGYHRRNKPEPERVYKCCHNRTHYGEYRCKAGQVSADRVEALAWGAVKTAMLDSDRMLVAMRKRQEEAAQSRRIIEQALVALVALDAKVQSKLDRFLDLYGSGDMDKAAYLSKKHELEAEMKGRAKERQDLEKRLNDCPVLTPEQEAQLAEFRIAIAARMAGEVPAAEQEKLYELLRPGMCLR